MGTDVKPGIQTSEFWVTVVGLIVSILLAFGVVTPSQADQVKTAAGTIAGAVVQIVGALGGVTAVIAYVRARAHVKASVSA